MWNSTRRPGVSSNMHRVPLFLAYLSVVLAQQPQQDPLDTAIQAVWQARTDGHIQEAAAARDQARALLQHTPVDSQGFAVWVQQVSQLYRNSSLNLQARRILQESLARTASLADSHPSRMAILTALGDYWQQDGNLLKAAEYLEKAAAAAPPHGAIHAYARLADLYQQLGRPDAVAAIAAKIRTLAAKDQTALARFYEQHGQLDEAAAIYAKLAEQSADPQAKTIAWQALARLDARQENYTGAIAAAQQAIAATQSSDDPGLRAQAFYQNESLAGYMRQAGQIEQADQLYQQLLQQNQGEPQQGQMLGMYARYLADTNRGPQGESLLQDYLAGSANPDPSDKAGVLYSLADLARRKGDSQKAEEYQRAAQALQPQPPTPPGQIRIAEELQQAQDAANEQRLDDAYALTLDALDIAAAGQAADAQQAEWSVPQIAQTMAANKDPVRAERLFQRVFALAQIQAVDTMQPLITVARQYPGFLMGQPERARDAPAAIEQYRGLLTNANGPDSGTLAEPLQMEIEFARSQSQWEQAEGLAREMLELQESLSGNTSEPYLRDLQIAAQTYETAGDSARALPLLRKAVTVADLLATPNNIGRRAQTRMDTALTLARLGQFDEAEALGEEALALQRTPPFEQQLEQIRGMRRGAGPRPAVPALLPAQASEARLEE